MTDEIGRDTPTDYFDNTVEETMMTANGRYIQRIYNREDETYGIQTREKRYGKPTVITAGIKNLEDAQQIMIGASEFGIVELLSKRDNK